MGKAILRILGAVAVGFAMLTLSCASVAISTDYDKNVDFTRFRTFSFLGGHIWVNGMADDNNTLVRDRIRNSVTSTLTARGMQPVTENPDVYVAYLRRKLDTEPEEPMLRTVRGVGYVLRPPSDDA